MKTMYKVFGIIALAAILTFSIAACGSPSGGPSGSGDGDGREAGVYETVRNNVTFTLTISPPGRARSTHLVGDTYVLVVKDGETEQISSGVVAEVRENDVVLQPSFKDAPPFTVRKNLSNGTKTSITGTITFDCGATRGGFAAPGGGGGGSSGGGGGSSGGGGSNTHSHSWGEWSITTFPTTINPLDGEESRTCSSCSVTENRALTEANFKPYFYGNTWTGIRFGTNPPNTFTLELSADTLKITRTDTNPVRWFKMENLTWTLGENPRKNNATTGNDLGVSVGFILACEDSDYTHDSWDGGNLSRFVGLSSGGLLVNLHESNPIGQGSEHRYTK